MYTEQGYVLYSVRTYKVTRDTTTTIEVNRFGLRGRPTTFKRPYYRTRVRFDLYGYGQVYQIRVHSTSIRNHRCRYNGTTIPTNDFRESRNTGRGYLRQRQTIYLEVLENLIVLIRIKQKMLIAFYL